MTWTNMIQVQITKSFIDVCMQDDMRFNVEQLIIAESNGHNYGFKNVIETNRNVLMCLLARGMRTKISAASNIGKI